MAANDEELRSKLVAFGMDVGPIDDNTRSLYVSMLKRREADSKKNRGRSSLVDRPVSQTSSSSILDSSKLSRVSRRGRSEIFSSDESRDASPEISSLPRRTSSPKKPPQASRRRADVAGYSPPSDSSAYSVSVSSYHPRGESSPPPSPPRNKYVRRPLHPPNYNYSSNGGFSDDELDQHSRPRLNGMASYSPASAAVHQASYSSSPRVRRRPPVSTTSSFFGIFKPSMIPKLIVTFAAIFFLILAVVYARMANQSPAFMTPSPMAEAPYNFTECGGEEDRPGDNCIHKDDLAGAQNTCRRIQEVLSTRAHKMMCSSQEVDFPAIDGMPFDAMYKVVFEKVGSEMLFNSAVYLISKNPDWGMEIVKAETHNQLTFPLYSPPLWCRLYRAATMMILQILLFLGLVILCTITYWLLQRRKVNLHERKRQINGLVEDITDLLTNNATDNPETPFLAIVDIRNRLAPNASKSSRAMALWRDAEEQFESTESARVAREKQRVNGEWFMTWRWLPPPNSNGNTSKVWQGKAFDGTPSCQPLTNCLKIKNMFNKTEEHGDEWVADVKRAIMDKCGPGHDILHMHVAKESSEGLVYAKMASLQAAGCVYKKLHGSWFAGRLVTAKYLREERYTEKFPESNALSFPLAL